MVASAAWETTDYTDIGAREEQQDRVAIFGQNDVLLLVLADGMGGHEGGALAAQAVVDTAQEMCGEIDDKEAARHLRSIIGRAHKRINAVGDERGIAPHSTCVLLHLADTTATWAHVGDSRLYRFSNGSLVDRTIDHSVVEMMRLQGRITEEEMKTHPDQNRLYEALGGERPPEISSGQAMLGRDEGFLLASDGLWENVSDRELEKALNARDLSGAIIALVDQAKASGGRNCDNISAAVARNTPAKRSFAPRLRRSLRLPLRVRR